MIEKYEYCRTVPRTFVQNCLNPGFGEKKSVFFIYSGNSLISHIGPTPPNWSRVQRKLIDVSNITHSARSEKHIVLSIIAIFQPKIHCI